MTARNFILIIFALCALPARAQPAFLTEGRIEFERRIHVWPILEDERYADQVKASTPQYKVDYFRLDFKQDEALYSYQRGTTKGYFGNMAALQNSVYTNWSEQRFLAKKNAFEEVLFIEDSLRSLKWKLTNDFRNIAGFECRRATAMTMDSVFIVAFYADEIETPAGPEGVGGLPGMILGLVINKLHTSWYATKIEAVKVSKPLPPSGGKVLKRADLEEKLSALPLTGALGRFNDRNLRL